MYVVVVDGVAVTLAVFVPLNPVDGLHTYVVAPLAVKVVLPFWHIDTSEPALIAGNKVNTIESLVEPQLFVAVYVSVTEPKFTSA